LINQIHIKIVSLLPKIHVDLRFNDTCSPLNNELVGRFQRMHRMRSLTENFDLMMLNHHLNSRRMILK